MNIALDKVNGKRITPQKGLSANCQLCKSEVVAKCGRIKIHHWAHKSINTCDKWWENETEWHKQWKNHFPIHWQEVVRFDNKSNERHIADVFNFEKELVIEFQNSRISVDELEARERFYKKMIWVINKNQIQISTSSLEVLIREIKEITNNFYSERINPYIRIPRVIMAKLGKFVSETLAMKNIGKREIKQLIDMFNDDIDNLIGENSDFGNKNDGLEPNEAKRHLLKPLEKKIIEEIESQSYAPDVYYVFKILKGSKTWNYAKCPVFLDTGDGLYLLYPNEIAKKISKERFVNYYRKSKK